MQQKYFLLNKMEEGSGGVFLWSSKPAERFKGRVWRWDGGLIPTQMERCWTCKLASNGALCSLGREDKWRLLSDTAVAKGESSFLSSLLAKDGITAASQALHSFSGKQEKVATACRLFAVPLGFCRRKKIAKVMHTIFNLEAKQVYFRMCPCSFWRDGRRGACSHPPVAKFFAFSWWPSFVQPFWNLNQVLSE